MPAIPLACAAALAVLDVIEEEKLRRARRRHRRRASDRLKPFARATTLLPIGDIRGLGAMVAFEIVKDRGTNEPDAGHRPSASWRKAAEHGLILLSCGVYANVIRVLVPLTVSDAIIDEGLDIIEKALGELAAK